MTEVGKLKKEVEELKAMLASATASAGRSGAEGVSEAERAQIDGYNLQLKLSFEANQKLALQAESKHP